MRSSHVPPCALADSHDSKALNTLPRCMRPVGDGAKRPQTEERLFIVYPLLLQFLLNGGHDDALHHVISSGVGVNGVVLIIFVQAETIG